MAIATRDPGRPGLAERFPGARIHAGYAAMLADPEVEAIYIATPHPAHAEWAIRAAEAGKHVLCEKPMAVSAAEAEAMVAAARRAGTFLGEAFMYRLHPMTARIVELVNSKVGGRPPPDPEQHRLQHRLRSVGPVVRQRYRGRRDSRCRLLPGVDGAAASRVRPRASRSSTRSRSAASRISARPAPTTGAPSPWRFPAASSPTPP